MGRIQGLAESGLLTGSTLLKSGGGYVFSITIAYSGVTAGHKCYLRDGTSETGLIEVCFVFGATSGIITKEWPQGKEFTTGIYWDEGTAGGADRTWTEITYK